MSKALSVLSNPAFYKSLWALAKMAGKEVGDVWNSYHSGPRPE